MAKAVWTGALAFGLVTIPVRLYPATEAKDVRFHLVDDRGRRVRYRRLVEAEPPQPEGEAAELDRFPVEAVGEAEGMPPLTRRGEPGKPGAEVAFEDLMRGYETADGRMVILSRDEVESVRPAPSRTIEIEDFVDLAEIDPVYFDKSYYLAPQVGADKPYGLLLRAMDRTGRVGIGRFVLRTKPHLVAIRPADGVLELETLFFADEVRDRREIVAGMVTSDVSDRELQMAEMLIETLKTEWNPAAYSDTYRQELLKRIAAKAPLDTVEEPAITSAGERVKELMDSLRASVEMAKKKQESRPSGKRTA